MNENYFIQLAAELREFEPALGFTKLDRFSVDKLYELDLGKKGAHGFSMIEINPDLITDLFDKDFWETLRLIQVAARRASEETINYTIRIKPYDSFQYTKRDMFPLVKPKTMIRFKGTIIARTDLEATPMEIKFECPKCGHTERRTNYTSEPKPKDCACGHKASGKGMPFKKLEVITRPTCSFQIIEDISILGKQEIPQTVNVLYNCCNDEKDIHRINNSILGKKVEVIGTVESLTTNTGSILCLQANNIYPVEEITITPEDEVQIQKFIKETPDPLMVIGRQICQNTYKNDIVKKALLLACIGFKQGKKYESPFHTMLIGDAGTAKSQLVLAFKDFIEGAIVVSAATKAGYLGSIMSDEVTNRPQYHAGALQCANGSILIVEETNTQDKDVQASLQTAMSDGYISLAQNRRIFTNQVEVTMLFTANPKNGKFDPNQLFQSQIDSPPPIVDRINLKIYMPVEDLSSIEDKGEIVRYMAKVKNNPQTITDIFAKKVIKYMRSSKNPILKPEVVEEIIVLLNTVEERMLDEYKKEKGSEFDEKEVRGMANRQKAAFMKLCIIHARAKMKNEVDKEDIEAVQHIFYECEWSKQLKMTGHLDDSVFRANMAQAARTHFPETPAQKKDAVERIIRYGGKKGITGDEICKRAKELNIDSRDVEKSIKYLIASDVILEIKTDLFIPKWDKDVTEEFI